MKITYVSNSLKGIALIIKHITTFIIMMVLSLMTYTTK